MNSPVNGPQDDAYWRRPPGGAPGPSTQPTTAGWPDGNAASTSAASTSAAGTNGPNAGGPNAGGPASWTYGGPPRAAPPPPGWRPPTLVQPPAPRALPPQNTQAIERAEQAARTVTVGVGLVAGAVLLVLLLVLCGRVLF